MASIDDRYRLRSVVHHCDGRYSVAEHGLGAYLVPKKPVEVTADLLHRTQRGIAYTASPFAYVFERTSWRRRVRHPVRRPAASSPTRLFIGSKIGQHSQTDSRVCDLPVEPGR